MEFLLSVVSPSRSKSKSCIWLSIRRRNWLSFALTTSANTSQLANFFLTPAEPVITTHDHETTDTNHELWAAVTCRVADIYGWV